jgi:hypothetical protein
MSIYTMRFSSEDDYERWYSRAGARINVLTIRGAGPMFQSSLDHSPSAQLHAEKPVVVRYQTADPDLAPPRRHHRTIYSPKLVPFYAAGAVGAAILFYALI